MTTMTQTPDPQAVSDFIDLANKALPDEGEFEKAAGVFGPISVLAAVVTVYICDTCGCRFMPDQDGDFFYRDRYTHVDAANQVGCGIESCVCHDIPYAFKVLPGHCATCESPCYMDQEYQIQHLDKNAHSHDPIYIAPVTEQDMDELKQGLLRIQHDLTD